MPVAKQRVFEATSRNRKTHTTIVFGPLIKVARGSAEQWAAKSFIKSWQSQDPPHIDKSTVKIN